MSLTSAGDRGESADPGAGAALPLARAACLTPQHGAQAPPPASHSAPSPNRARSNRGFSRRAALRRGLCPPVERERRRQMRQRRRVVDLRQLQRGLLAGGGRQRLAQRLTHTLMSSLVGRVAGVRCVPSWGRGSNPEDATSGPGPIAIRAAARPPSGPASIVPPIPAASVNPIRRLPACSSWVRRSVSTPVQAGAASPSRRRRPAAPARDRR